MEEDAFGTGGLFPRGAMGRMPSSIRAMASMAGLLSSSTAEEMRVALNQIKQKDDPNAQYVGLQSLSNTLLMANEDTLAGHFSPDQYVKEFISLMQPQPHGVENPEMELLACRCIANLIEALPQATATVVYNGAVPVIISKLLTIEFMDLAEQALTTLQKISQEFPASIVRDGGLTACLQYLDFFATGTQRTAVTTAANCCRNIPEESFPIVKEVMPNLLNVLNSNDQKVVEQGSLCITRIVDSFKYQDEKMAELMNADLLKVILRLLLPGSTNFVSANIHTQFLRLLAATARASPQLTKELFRLDVTDTLYQILTGVSPPPDDGNVAAKIDSVVVMQALIHRPRDQIFETLSVICELLPGIEYSSIGFLNELVELHKVGPSAASSKPPISERLEVLRSCKNELRRFATVLFPTLTDAYSSTVNLSVRQRVLTAQLKMLCNFDLDILEDTLRPVPYASFLASNLSQQDHPFLVTAGLQAAETLLQRLGSIYRYQFYREGVIAEVRKLANRPLHENEKPQGSPRKASGSSGQSAPPPPPPPPVAPLQVTVEDTAQVEALPGEQDHHDSEDEDEEDEDVDMDDIDDGHEDEGSEGSSDGSSVHDQPPSSIPRLENVQDVVTRCAQRFIAQHESTEGAELRDKATRTLDELNDLVLNISDCYDNGRPDQGAQLFSQLAKAFEGNALESITSYELLSSKVVHTLVDIFDVARGQSNLDARSAFVEAFMGTTIKDNIPAISANSPATPFSVLVRKLQDLLSRSEHFEVVTINSNSYDNSRSSATATLSKQIRVRLVAEGEGSDIPAQFQTIMVSIHAIANLKALEDYLRPRFTMEQLRRSRASGSGRDVPRGGGFAAALASLDSPEALLSRRLASTPAPPTGSTAPPPGRSKSDRQSSRLTQPTGDAKTEGSGPTTGTPLPRRAARKNKSQGAQPSPPPAPPAMDESPEASQNTLECADETQISDQEDLHESGELLGEFEEEVDAEDTEQPDPSAVNMEVAPSGRVTARKDDGTTISTPTRSGGSAESRPGSGDRRQPPPPSSLSRSLFSRMPDARMSYAAAIQSIPTDWHLEFSVNGKRIPHDMTIYKAVHSDPAPPTTSDTSRSVWMNTHTIHYKRVSGPPPAEGALSSRPATPPEGSSGLPPSLEKNPITAVILKLLRILHEMNDTIEELLGEKRKSTHIIPEPLSQFVNTKLTAKMNRQLEEPLIVASNSLPSWSEDLARLYPFLFPFETRHLFLQSTSFGYARSINRWQSAQQTNDLINRHRDDRPQLGRPQRQKVRIQRSRFLDSAVKVMDMYGHAPAILEVEYFDEVGTGLGPTLEFYSSASKEFSKRKLKLWRENESDNIRSEFAFGKQGLFPAPMSEQQASSSQGEKILNLFRSLGKFVARSMLDSRIIDISFNATFFRIEYGSRAMSPNLATVKTVDEDLAKSLQTLKQFDIAKRKILEQHRLSHEQKQQKLSLIRVADARIEDLGLDFTLPGYPTVELIPNGSNTSVTIANVGDYVDTVIDFTLGKGVRRQIESFRQGFSQVFAYAALRAFTPDELVMLFGRVEEDWSMENLMDSIKADHGYNLDSRSVRNLLQTMTEFSIPQRRDFLQFVTGSPKLPIGGFRALMPMFTVVMRSTEAGHVPDEYLPSCMTCGE